jgi:hypothetical protein
MLWKVEPKRQCPERVVIVLSTRRYQSHLCNGSCTRPFHGRSSKLLAIRLLTISLGLTLDKDQIPLSASQCGCTTVTFMRIIRYCTVSRVNTLLDLGLDKRSAAIRLVGAFMHVPWFSTRRERLRLSIQCPWHREHNGAVVAGWLGPLLGSFRGIRGGVFRAAA